MGGELRVLAVAAQPSHAGVMSAAAAITGREPGTSYQRQTPSVWQAMGRAIWSTLESAGRRRAARDLDELARRWARIDPALAAQLRAAASATPTDTQELES
jgi:S-adenosylmethionine:diacylglycerol 3-amino-3-carboxypropyl transferase